MQNRFASLLVAMVIAAAVVAPSAYAITHTTDYKTNMGNFRTCTDPLLDTCGYADVLSPSKFYLQPSNLVTVIHKDDGTVQLRIDSSTISTDQGISYGCSNETFECITASPNNKCKDGPHKDASCSKDRCLGGSNDGATCTVASECPGGGCIGGASCVAQTCDGGPREHLACGSPNPSCTSVVDTSGWSLVFRGNQSSMAYSGAWHYSLVGDGDSGCMKVCPFSLNSSGAINSAGLTTCTTSGNCGLLETFHHVELRDPDGEVLAIPTVGLPRLQADGVTPEDDPAKWGDCSHPYNPSLCP